MIQKSALPARLLALTIAVLVVWQAGCVRIQPTATQADRESRDDPPAKPPDEPSDEPSAGLPHDLAAKMADELFGTADPSAKDDSLSHDMGDPFTEGSAAEEPTDENPFDSAPADVAAGESPPANRADEPAEPAWPAPRLLFYPAEPGARPGPPEAAIEQALDEPISLELAELPLEDVAVLLRDKCRINVAIDRREMHDFGVATSDVSITGRFADVPLRSALRQMFRGTVMAWTIRNEALVFTVSYRAEVTHVYDLADLVTFRDEHGELWEDYLMLEDAIMTAVAPQSWAEMGGTGGLRGVTLGRAKVLVVLQTEQVHRQIARLLEDLRAAARQNPGDGRPPLKKRRPQQRRGIGGPLISVIPVVG